MRICLSLLLSAISACLVQADVIVGFDFDGNVLTPTTGPTASITSSSFAYVGNATPAFVIGNPSSGRAYSANSWSLDSALDDYFTFTLMVETGKQLDIDSIMFDERRSATGPRGAEVQVNGIKMESFVLPDDISFRTQSADDNPLGSLTGSVSIQIFGFGAEKSAGTWRLDNVSVNGMVSAGPQTVPEPSSLLLTLTTCVLGAAIARRTRRKGSRLGAERWADEDV